MMVYSRGKKTNLYGVYLTWVGIRLKKNFQIPRVEITLCEFCDCKKKKNEENKKKYDVIRVGIVSGTRNNYNIV